MKRTSLYYPTISIPTGSWLRRTLLYWDEIASIVPQDWEQKTLIPFSPDIEFLQAENEFRPVRPDLLVMQGPWKNIQAFEEELKARIQATAFQHYLQDQRQVDARIHVDKVSGSFFDDFLRPAGLARKDDSDPDWFLFERRTALLYMSCLARYLAEIDREAATPSTDLPIYERLSLDALDPQEGFTCVDIQLRKMLPVPREDVSLSDILHFKRRRRQELLRFRELLDELHSSLANAESKADIRDASVSTAEKLERGIQDLKALLDDSRLATLASTLKSIISVKSPTLWAAIGVDAGQATRIADLPLGWTTAGIGVLGTIEIAHHLIDSRNKKRATLRDSPFAYAYHAEKEGLV